MRLTRRRTSFFLVLSVSACKLEPNLVALDERECERSWAGCGCRCRGAMGRGKLCVQVYSSGPAQPQQATNFDYIGTAIMERVQFQQEQVGQGLGSKSDSHMCLRCSQSSRISLIKKCSVK